MDNYIGFIYCWTNKTNQMKYIGLHVGKVDDGYVGSGVYFKKAITKYGISNFDRQILYFETKDVQSLYQKEYEIIVEANAVKSSQYYNLTAIDPKFVTSINGINIRLFTEEHRQNISRGRIGIKDSSETKTKKKEKSGTKGMKWFNNGVDDIKCFPENVPIGFVVGRLKVPNPGTGMKWFNNGTVAKRFLPNEVPDGWVQGRMGIGGLSGDKNVSKRPEVREKISKSLKGRRNEVS